MLNHETLMDKKSDAPQKIARCDACDWYRERLQQLIEQLKKCDAANCAIAKGSEQYPRYQQHRSKILRHRDAVLASWQYHENLHRAGTNTCCEIAHQDVGST